MGGQREEEMERRERGRRGKGGEREGEGAREGRGREEGREGGREGGRDKGGEREGGTLEGEREERVNTEEGETCKQSYVTGCALKCDNYVLAPSPSLFRTPTFPPV